MLRFPGIKFKCLRSVPLWFFSHPILSPIPEESALNFFGIKFIVWCPYVTVGDWGITLKLDNSFFFRDYFCLSIIKEHSGDGVPLRVISHSHQCLPFTIYLIVWPPSECFTNGVHWLSGMIFTHCISFFQSWLCSSAANFLEAAFWKSCLNFCNLILQVSIKASKIQHSALDIDVLCFHHSPKVGIKPFDFSIFANGAWSLSLVCFEQVSNFYHRLICFVTCLYDTVVRSGPSISSPGLATFGDLAIEISSFWFLPPALLVILKLRSLHG